MAECISDCEHLPLSSMVVGLHGAKLLIVIRPWATILPFILPTMHLPRHDWRHLYVPQIQFWIRQVHQG